jgi:hypothetical protein
MNIFSVAEQVIQRLSGLPGLGFLHRYRMEIGSRHLSVKGRVDRYKGYVSSVRGAGAEVAQAARGSKAEEVDDDSNVVDEYDEDDDESYMQ